MYKRQAKRNNFGAADVKQAMEGSDGMRCKPSSAEWSIGVSGNFPVEAGFGCFFPVSYTHLDVYKRQMVSMAIGFVL